MEVAHKQEQLEELTEQLARLAAEATQQGRARLAADVQRETIAAQLSQLRGKTQEQLKVVREHSELSELREDALRVRLRHLTDQQGDQQRAKQRILALYVQAVSTKQSDRGPQNAAKLEGPANRQDEARSNSESATGGGLLQLDCCGLRDDDMPVVAKLLLKHSVQIHTTHLDLSSNALSDGGAEALAVVLASQACALRTVDLRKNAISTDGIRMIAEALEGRCIDEINSTARRQEQMLIQHVYIHQNGKIEALGMLTEKLQNENLSNTDQFKEGKVTCVLTIDVRDNMPVNIGDNHGVTHVPESFVPVEPQISSIDEKNKAALNRKNKPKHTSSTPIIPTPYETVDRLPSLMPTQKKVRKVKNRK